MNYCNKANQPYQAIDSESIESLEDSQIIHKVSRYAFHPICTSEDCSKSPLGVEKNVARFQETCNDCGYYLYWEKRVIS